MQLFCRKKNLLSLIKKYLRFEVYFSCNLEQVKPNCFSIGRIDLNYKSLTTTTNPTKANYFCLYVRNMLIVIFSFHEAHYMVSIKGTHHSV